METIGDYRLIRLLGEGGMGKVYEAEERLSERRVALKVLRPELSRLESARKLFLNEMAVMAKLDHPNIVRALAFREVDDKLVMALELLEGETIRSFLSSNERADVNEAVSIAVQVARALCEAHGREPAIVHRDLKPENVMLLADGSVKVMDFGIAKVLAAAGNTTTHSVGTLAYMSPEQIDASELDGRSDLYCLGLLLYELLAGRPPFESASPRELLNLQCTAPPPPLPEEVRRGLPRGIERLLYALLEKDADDRPESARAVLDELDDFCPATNASGTERAKPVAGLVGPPAPRRKTARPSTEKQPPRSTPAAANDTIAMIDRACAPRHVAPRRALLIVLAASLFAAGATWVLRAAGAGPEPSTSSFETRR